MPLSGFTQPSLQQTWGQGQPMLSPWVFRPPVTIESHWCLPLHHFKPSTSLHHAIICNRAPSRYFSDTVHQYLFHMSMWPRLVEAARFRKEVDATIAPQWQPRCNGSADNFLELSGEVPLLDARLPGAGPPEFSLTNTFATLRCGTGRRVPSHDRVGW